MTAIREMLARVGVMIATVLAAGAVAAGQAGALTARQAADHLGEQATVCGKVATARYAQSTRGAPTFLNLDAPYPNPVFTIVIWKDNRDKFGKAEERYRDKSICVTGKITSYRGEAQMVATDPRQITLKQ